MAKTKGGKIVAVANQKGGVGKTTTTVNLSASLAATLPYRTGKRVLVVDIDPQGNTTSGLGVDKEKLLATSYEMLLDEKNARECICSLPAFHLDLIPSSLDLAGAEVELIDVAERESLLMRALSEVRDAYDYILIDCPPSLNVLTINAFKAADSILVPIQCEFYAMEGLTQLINTINLVKRKLNPDIQIEGILFTMYDSRANLSNQVIEEVSAFLPDRIYETRIPRNVRLAEAPSFGLPVLYYDKSSRGAVSYLELADEFLERNS